MALPDTCLGNSIDSRCVEYDGDSLNVLIEKLLAAINAQNTNQSQQSVRNTDEIQSKSSMLNGSSVCSANIVDRNFTYTLTATSSTSTLGWNLLGFIGSLPSGYGAVVNRIRVTGSGTNSVIADSSSPSSAVTIGINQYPVTVDFLVRVKTTCGDVDAEYKLNLISPSNTGKHGAVLNITDLNPSSGTVNLTTQLNNMESKLAALGTRVESLPDYAVNLQQAVSDIESTKRTVADPGSFEVTYSDNGVDKSSGLSDAITAVRSDVNQINTTLATITNELTNLKASINSINART